MGVIQIEIELFSNFSPTDHETYLFKRKINNALLNHKNIHILIKICLLITLGKCLAFTFITFH